MDYFSLRFLPHSLSFITLLTVSHFLQATDSGDAVPASTLTTLSAETVKLDSLTDGEATILVFFRGSWSPYCTQHIAWLAAAQSDLRAMGYQTIAICGDTPETLNAFAQNYTQDILLLSDPELKAAEAFDVVYEASNGELQTYEDFGIDLKAATGRADNRIAMPSLFIIRKGEIVYQYINDSSQATNYTSLIMQAAQKYAPSPSGNAKKIAAKHDTMANKALLGQTAPQSSQD